MPGTAGHTGRDGKLMLRVKCLACKAAWSPCKPSFAYLPPLASEVDRAPKVCDAPWLSQGQQLQVADTTRTRDLAVDFRRAICTGIGSQRAVRRPLEHSKVLSQTSEVKHIKSIGTTALIQPIRAA